MHFGYIGVWHVRLEVIDLRVVPYRLSTGN